MISPEAQAVAESLLSDRLTDHRAWWHQVRTSGSPLEPTLFRPEDDARGRL